MESRNEVSTGRSGLDRIIDGLRPGDNVVWQVENVEHYRAMVQPFVEHALGQGRKVNYLRFATHEPLLDRADGVSVHYIDSSAGFESFTTTVHRLVAESGPEAYFVFDCLSELLNVWHSDLMVTNFFKVTCPFIFDLDSVAYFGLMRNHHSFSTIATIRESTQVLLDLYQISGRTYVHPLKVQERYSPTMFFPHELRGDEARSVTSSAAAARLFASLNRSIDPPDHWQVVIQKGWQALSQTEKKQQRAKELLISVLIGREGRMVDLCREYMTLVDLLAIASREIGTGFIGGKSVGMLAARAVLENDPDERFSEKLEPHDSYFLGSDLFYTFIVANGWWKLWTEHKTKDGFFTAGARLKDLIPTGRFPAAIREQFMQMLEYFGQSPIIVRSSSLLEDNFGNAFAGKYESVFCTNQGSPEERYEAFERAVLTVYASAVSEEALQYRKNRSLVERDEQMAVLVQRVSGDHHGDMFFPHAAGVANSSNLYVWDPDIDMDAGMLRLVFGLGTRAVDRTQHDYAKIVTLDDPLRRRQMDADDAVRFSQRYVDVLSLRENREETIPLTQVLGRDLGADWDWFTSPDRAAIRRLRELGRRPKTEPVLLDFQRLLAESDFAATMREILHTIQETYDYPVDMEFTVNLTAEGSYRINIVQCRPLQTRGLGRAVEMPTLTDPCDCLLSTVGNFMGGNVRVPLDYVVMVRPEAYLELGQQARYAVAREVGFINKILKDRSFMLMGPGRWGTTIPSLGIPVNFTEISNATVLCEFTYPEGGFRPELSYGSHFFQDLVETGIFYVALFDDKEHVVLNTQRVLDRENQLAVLDPGGAGLANVLHVAHFDDLELYSDIVSQRLVCR